jgi:hypothetical protein
LLDLVGVDYFSTVNFVGLCDNLCANMGETTLKF